MSSRAEGVTKEMANVVHGLVLYLIVSVLATTDMCLIIEDIKRRR